MQKPKKGMQCLLHLSGHETMGEPGTFYHVHDVKGRREVDRHNLFGVGIYLCSLELVIEASTCAATMAQKLLATAPINRKVDWCRRFSVSDTAPDRLNVKKFPLATICKHPNAIQ